MYGAFLLFYIYLSEDPSLTTCFFLGHVGMGGWGHPGVSVVVVVEPTRINIL